jgi:23S rRNA (uracil1939-C5)-methyltransferase
VSTASGQVIRILRLAAGGDGVGRLEDGRAVFVPRTAPGDLVELARVRSHRRFARALIGRVIEPAAGRMVPRCPHYTRDECGGCQLQHLDGETQRAARAGFVGEALRRMARLDRPDPPLAAAPDDWGYRSKLTLHASPDGRRIGLHPVDRPDQLFDLEWCYITSPRLMELWREVRRRRRLLPTALQRLVLRLDRSGGRHLVAMVAGTAQWRSARELAGMLASAGVPATLWWQPEGGAARSVAGSDGAFPATVFEQVHPAMGDRAREAALDALGPIAGLHVWDLYAGIGETTARLVAAGASVESVESDVRAVRLADERGPAPSPVIRRHAGRTEDVVASLRDPAAVITNPPRTGMDERVTADLRARRPRRIVYVSCDPATLARDIVRLGSGFEVRSVEAFDLFPQTAHVESVTLLEAA